MNIVVLAWGSLIWDPLDLCIIGDFAAHGPSLPLEFSRVSGGERLTLVIDEANGASCQTYVAQSAFDDLDEALLNLWRREGRADEKLPNKIRASGRVGFVDVASKTRSSRALERHPDAVATIEAWAREAGHDAVIWTALARNFEEQKGQAFSLHIALTHLEALSLDDLGHALNYFRSAPTEVQTPLRTAVAQRWPQG